MNKEKNIKSNLAVFIFAYWFKNMWNNFIISFFSHELVYSIDLKSFLLNEIFFLKEILMFCTTKIYLQICKTSTQIKGNFTLITVLYLNEYTVWSL